MSALICGSFAYDTIMGFPDQFKNHILPDKVHMLNVAFLVPELRREFGGCAGNIAYNLKLLGDEPLASGVEHGPMQLRVEAAQVGIPLHHFIDSEIWEQPASPRQSSIQQVLKDTMQWHLPLSRLGLQQANPVWPDMHKPSQVALCCDVVRHEPTDLPRAHACDKPEEYCTVQHPGRPPTTH